MTALTPHVSLARAFAFFLDSSSDDFGLGAGFSNNALGVICALIRRCRRLCFRCERDMGVIA